MQLIDKIHQFGIIDSCKCSRPLYSDEINLKYITDIKTVTDNETGEVVNNYGSIENLKLSWNWKYVNIHGSLSKYSFGNNLNLLTRKQAEKVLTELSDKLGIDLLPSKISQLDTAFDVEMKLPVKSYYDFFGERKGMMRTPPDRHSLYYSNPTKTDNFYDKIKELKKKGFTVREIENLMRMEKRDKTASIAKIIQRFGLDELTIADLLTREIYFEFARDLLKEYESIAKKQSFYYNFKRNAKPNDIIRLNAIENINRVGLENVYSQIENARALDKLSHIEYYSRMKSKVKKLSQDKACTRPYPAMTELDGQMRSYMKYALWWDYVL